MEFDKQRKMSHNLTLSPKVSLAAVIHEQFGVVRVAVIDFDKSSPEFLSQVVSTSHEAGAIVFLGWYPRSYSRPHAYKIHQKWIDAGAYFIERESATESLQTCWERVKPGIHVPATPSDGTLPELTINPKSEISAYTKFVGKRKVMHLPVSAKS